MLYDTLIVLALLMLATAIALPLNKGDAFDAGNVLFKLYLTFVCIGFFLLFWRKGGQTLGMRAWKIQLVNDQHAVPSYSQLFIRLLAAVPSLALLGFGLFWSLFDQDKLALYDRVSGTRVVLKPF